jgi:RNA polymerase-binding transcription factor DksA
MATSTRTADDAAWPKRAHDGSWPTPQLPRLRRALLGLLHAQQEVLREHRRSLREAPPLESVVGADDEERAAQELETGLDIALLEMRARQVQEIETALRLLESGTYGRCIDCEGTILPSRLLARPSAVRCRTCQEALERSDESRRPAIAPSREDLALGGSARWPGRASTAPKPRRRHRPAAVPARPPLSFGGVSL